MFGKRFQQSLFCLPSEPLVVRKHERLLGRWWSMIWPLCVCANIYNFIMWERISEMRVLLFVLNCILESSFCYWLQISSISRRCLFIYQLKFQIKLNLDFHVSKFIFLLDFESLWVYGWSFLLTISRWNFVLSCSFF